MPRASSIAIALCAALMLVASTGRAQPPGLENVGVDEHLGTQLPLDARFRDHTGRLVRLGDYFDGERPVALNFAYHTCPTFCSLVLDATMHALAAQDWTVGRELTVLTISIDPRDTPQVAADARLRLLNRYGRPAAQRGWHFLVPERSLNEQQLLAAYGGDSQVRRVAAAAGFRFQWMARQRQYAHPGVLMLLTPEGRVARYLHGLQHEPSDVRLGLLEASEGRSLSTVERAMLYCYRYDAHAQGYTLVASRVMQFGGGLTALLLFGSLGWLWARELRRKRRSENKPSESKPSALAAEASVRS